MREKNKFYVFICIAKRGSLYKSAKLIYLLIKWQKKLKQNAYSICIFILIESFYLCCTVLQVFPWLPWIIFCPITLPSDQVLYHTFPFPLLKDFVNLQRQNILSNYSNTVSSVWLNLQSTLKVILHVIYLYLNDYFTVTMIMVLIWTGSKLLIAEKGLYW